MKRFFTTILVSAIAAIAMFAQNTEPEKMVVKMKSGATTTFTINDIEDITFEQGEQPDQPDQPVAKKVYKIDLNNDFSTGHVQKVMDGDTQVAEMADEYVRYYVTEGETSTKVYDGKLTVVYPIGKDGKADLTNGLAANGAKLSWDVTKNVLASYTPAESETTLSTIYLNDLGQFVSADAADGAVETTQEEYTVVDKRSALDDSFTYHVVKVGTQYWFEENLHATLYRDGSSIKMYKSTEAAAWDNNTTGAYHVYGDDMQYNWLDWGALYNGYAVLSDKGLAPEGWAVTTVADWNSLKAYLATGQSTKVKSTDTSWTKVGTNITGLNIMPGGYFSKATGDNADGNDVYFWNSDKSTDPIFKTETLATTRVVNSIITTGTHGYNFGHYVRCIRK